MGLSKDYSSLQDLVSKAGSFKNEVSPSWTYNESPTIEAARFYNQWSNYLSPIPQAFTFFMGIPGWLAKTLYSLTRALETIYNNLFRLFGLFDYLTDKQTLVGQFFDGLQKVGLVVFVLLLTLSILSSFLTGLLKYRDVINHFLLVTVVTALLPQAIRQFSRILATSGQSIRNVKETTKNGQQSTDDYQTLSIQPFTGNVVDLYVVIKNNFDINKLKMDDNGYLNAGPDTHLNTINDKNLMMTDFSSWYGGTDKEVLEEFRKKGDKDKNYYGASSLLSSVLKSGDEGNVRIDAVKPGTWSDLENVFSSVYMRYNVNWIALLAQQIILLTLLICMSVKFVQSLFQVIVAGMIAPIVGYTSVEKSDKFKELLYTIFGTLTGIFFEVIMLRVAFSILRDFPKIALSGVEGITGSFGENLTYWEGVAASIVIYLGVYFALVSGNNAVERWLGVSTGQQSTKNSLLGTAGVAAGLGVMASRRGKSAAKSVPNVAKRAAKGVSTTARGASKGAAGVGKGMASAGRSIAKGAGAVRGVSSGISQAGGVKNAMTNVGSKAGQRIKDSASNVTEGVQNSARVATGSLKESYNAGKNSTAKALGTSAKGVGGANQGTKNKPTRDKQEQKGIGGTSGSQINTQTSGNKTSENTKQPDSSANNSGVGKGISSKGNTKPTSKK